MRSDEVERVDLEAKRMLRREFGFDALWRKRLARAEKGIDMCVDFSLIPTPFFVEALSYWDRAKELQDVNLGLIPSVGTCGDELQDTIPIYDTVQRRYAGFSNALEQLRYGFDAPKFKRNRAHGRDYPKFDGTDEEWAYLCLVHRVTGSGASFELDHGWRNTILPWLEAHMAVHGYKSAQEAILKFSETMFTSIGNQIPPFNKKTHPDARLAGNEYLGLVAPKLVKKVLDFLNGRVALSGRTAGIQMAVNVALEEQRKLGWKQFRFVLTAWVMDLAEYLPHLVDPRSDCYHGKNACEALELCFRPEGGARMTKQQFYDHGTRLFADLTGTNPMDVEDAAPGCDLIRWLENYVPKGYKGPPVRNSCCLDYRPGAER